MNEGISKRRRFTAITAALMAISSCSGDEPKFVSYPIGPNDSKRFTFELWEEPLAGGFGSHAAIIVRDRQQPDEALILQGLATDRKTLKVRPVGDPARDNIYAYVDQRSITDLKDGRIKIATLYDTNDGVDMAERLATMLQSAKAINDRHYAYQLLSSSKLAGVEAYNSNATAYTLALAGGLAASSVTFKGYAPGWGQSMPVSKIKIPAFRIRTIKDQEAVEDKVNRLARDVDGDIFRFLVDADIHGETAHRKKVVIAYKELPLCRTVYSKNYATSEILYGDDGTPLVKDDVIDNFVNSAYHGSASYYNVLLDSKSKALCKTSEYNRLPTRAEAKTLKRIKPKGNEPV